jgi:small subunit ribosomal protein S17
MAKQATSKKKPSAARPSRVVAPKLSATPAEKKLAQRGVVQADTRQQTRTVTIQFAQPHAKYGKMVRKTTVLQVHDQGNESRRGDIVEIAPCRPVSKTKRWRLLRVVERRSVIDPTLEAPKV